MEALAEVRAHIEPFRDGLMRWVDERTSVSSWDMHQFDDGSATLDCRVQSDDGTDPVVRISLTFIRN